MGRIKLSKRLFKVLFPKKKTTSSDSTTSTSGGGGSSSSNNKVGQYSYNEFNEVHHPSSSVATHKHKNKHKNKHKHNNIPFPSSSPFLQPRSAVKGENKKYDDFLKNVMDDNDLLRSSLSSSSSAAESSPVTVTATLTAASTPQSNEDSTAIDAEAKKVQFSSEEKRARKKAIARQKRILSKASSRLDAISNTSLESIEEASRRRNIGSDGNGNNSSSRDDFSPDVARSSSSSSVSGRRKGRGRSGRTRGSNASPTTLPSSDSHSSSLGDIKEEEGCTISIINEESVRGTSSSSLDAPDAAAAVGNTVGNAAYHPPGGTSGKNIGSAVLLHESPDGKLGQEKKAAEQSTEQLDEVNDEVNDELGVDDEGQVISDAGPILDEGSTKTSHSTKLESRENEVVGINTINDTHRQDQNQDGNDNKPSEQDEDRIQFFILLLCPTSRIFELIEIAASDAPHNESTLSDVLCLIPEKCTDERLLQKEYWGLVRPSDRVNFVHLHAKVFDTADDDGGSKATEGDDDDTDRHHREKQDAIQGGDVLVAILKDYTGFEMSDISKPIVRDASFRNMIRRRSKKMVRGGKKRNSWQSDDGSMRSSRSVQSSRSGRRGQRNSATTKQAALPEIDCGLSAEIDSNNNQDGTSPGTTPKKANLAANVNDGKENNRYSSLCKKLENLSQKLTNVDDEILADDVSVEGSKLSNSLQEETISPQEDAAAHNITHTTVEEAGLHARQPSFKMAPEMLADEVAAKIEDIFAGHDVELVAVDAEDEHEHDSDEDTFATAKSRRSTKSMRSSRSSKQSKPQISIEDENENIMPVLEITTTKKKKKKRKPRKNRPPSKFAFEEDDMMLQIEAMARQADAVFGSRKAIANGSVGVAGTTIIDPMMEGAAAAEPNYHVIDENTETTHAAQNDVNDEGTASSDAKKALRTSVSFEGVSSSEGCNVDERLVPSNSTGSKQSALSRYFLNTSASMVSTMVKGPNGAVNEVHMLQYLGVPIVCMAANVMQQQQGGTSQGQQDFFSSRRKRNSFGADVLQSAMFLAFMVNGQRYLAKVTKK